MASKARKRKSGPATIDAIVKVMQAHGPSKAMKVADIIAAVKRPAPTVYSVIYGEAKMSTPRVAQVSKGTFKLTAAGRKHAE